MALSKREHDVDRKIWGGHVRWGRRRGKEEEEEEEEGRIFAMNHGKIHFKR
jgi:hypothetical protein